MCEIWISYCWTPGLVEFLKYFFYFWDYNIILSFPPSHSFLPYKPPYSLSNTWSIFYELLFYTMYHIYIYINLQKYKLFCLYNITCVYVFRTGHLALNKQLFFSPSEKTVSLALSKSQRVRDSAGRLSIAMMSEGCWFLSVWHNLGISGKRES